MPAPIKIKFIRDYAQAQAWSSNKASDYSWVCDRWPLKFHEYENKEEDLGSQASKGWLPELKEPELPEPGQRHPQLWWQVGRTRAWAWSLCSWPRAQGEEATDPASCLVWTAWTWPWLWASCSLKGKDNTRWGWKARAGQELLLRGSAEASSA